MLKISIVDWEGKYGEYEVVSIRLVDENLYSVTFVNSIGDIEKVTREFGRVV